MVHNLAGDNNGTLKNSPLWSTRVVPVGSIGETSPVTFHVAEGDRYNVNRYDYPAEATPDSASYVFGVNTGTYRGLVGQPQPAGGHARRLLPLAGPALQQYLAPPIRRRS